jgi:uncharacterized membrane protein
VTEISLLDIASVAWFAFCASGYKLFADHWRAQHGLMGAVARHRLAWMERMIERENRIVDTTLVATMSNSVSFFAQTSIFILGGLIAVLGAQERVREVIADVPFAASGSAVLWEAKIALLIVIFVFAFFKFTWSLRLFNYLLVLIGATPLFDRIGAGDAASAAQRTARMSNLAVNHFNVGIRAYYFGLAALAWFVHPLLFIAASAWVVLVLWRREFRSHTLAALKD